MHDVNLAEPAFLPNINELFGYTKFVQTETFSGCFCKQGQRAATTGSNDATV